MTPPHDDDAEAAVLSAMLEADPAVDVAAGILTAADFYQPANGMVFQAIVDLHGRLVIPDVVAVMDELRRTGHLSLAGGAPRLHDLAAFSLNIASVGWHAGIVRRCSDLRTVAAAGVRLHQLAHQGDADPDVVKAAARVELDALDRRDSGTEVDIAAVVDEVVDHARRGIVDAVPTPWRDLDARIIGWRPGCLYTVGARPGLGKSAIALNAAWAVARAGRRALVFSLEMPRTDVVRRVLAAHANVPYEHLLRGNLTPQESERLARHRGAVDVAPLVVDDRSGVSVAQIAARCRVEARRGLALVVVDYLQLLSPSDRRAPREQQVAEMSRGLKILAGDLGVSILMCAQLNRGVEARADKHPTLADLRESGAVEQDSDVVLLLYRDDEKAPDRLHVGVGKNRHGPTGSVELEWDGAHMRARSLDWRVSFGSAS